jgi:hypothetical protein
VGDESSQDRAIVTDGSSCSESEIRLYEEIRDDAPALERFVVDNNKEVTNKETSETRNEGGVKTSEHPPPHFVSFGFPVNHVSSDASKPRTMSGNGSTTAKNLNDAASTLVMSIEASHHNNDTSFLDSVGNVSMDVSGFQPDLNSTSTSVQSAPVSFDKFCQELETPSSPLKSVRSSPMMYDDLCCEELESPPETIMRSVRSSPALTRFSNTDAALELKATQKSPTEFVIDEDVNNMRAVTLTLDEAKANTKKCIRHTTPVRISVEVGPFDADQSSIEIEQPFQFNKFIKVNNDSFETPKIPSSSPEVSSPCEMPHQCTDDILLADMLPWQEKEWNKLEKTWEARMWQFLDEVEDRFLRCGFVVGLHDQRGTVYTEREDVRYKSASLDLTQSTISEEQDQSASLDLYIDEDKSPAYVF